MNGISWKTVHAYKWYGGSRIAIYSSMFKKWARDGGQDHVINFDRDGVYSHEKFTVEVVYRPLAPAPNVYLKTCSQNEKKQTWEFNPGTNRLKVKDIDGECDVFPQDWMQRNGCTGAVWSSGSPSKQYCDGKNGRYPWFAKCCKWSAGSCKAETSIGKRQCLASPERKKDGGAVEMAVCDTFTSNKAVHADAFPGNRRPLLANIDGECAVLPRSGLERNGCTGAVWGSGSPSKQYCDGKNGRYPWFAKCCKWSSGSCKANGADYTVALKAGGKYCNVDTTNWIKNMGEGGICLAEAGNRNNGDVKMGTCYYTPSSLKWTYYPSTLRIKTDTGRCLDSGQGSTKGGRVRMWDCKTNNNNQKWYYNKVTGSIRHKHGKCLDARVKTEHGGKVHMWDCSPGNENQKWFINVKGLVRCDRDKAFKDGKDEKDAMFQVETGPVKSGKQTVQFKNVQLNKWCRNHGDGGLMCDDNNPNINSRYGQNFAVTESDTNHQPLGMNEMRLQVKGGWWSTGYNKWLSWRRTSDNILNAKGTVRGQNDTPLTGAEATWVLELQLGTGACVESMGSTNANVGVREACDARRDQQRFFYNAGLKQIKQTLTRGFRQTTTSKCMIAYQDADWTPQNDMKTKGNPVRMTTCNPSDSRQHWEYNATTQQFKQPVSRAYPTTRCMAIKRNMEPCKTFDTPERYFMRGPYDGAVSAYNRKLLAGGMCLTEEKDEENNNLGGDDSPKKRLSLKPCTGGRVSTSAAECPKRVERDGASLGRAHSDPNGECSALPNSGLERNGCTGAVWGSGSPSKQYCDGKNGRYPWFAKCCRWSAGSCKAKDDADWTTDCVVSSVCAATMTDPPVTRKCQVCYRAAQFRMAGTGWVQTGTGGYRPHSAPPGIAGTGSNSNICCSGSCGTCGGSGCGGRPGGAAGCCKGSITSANRKCEIGHPPPCIITRDSTGAVIWKSGRGTNVVDASGNVVPTGFVAQMAASVPSSVNPLALQCTGATDHPDCKATWGGPGIFARNNLAAPMPACRCAASSQLGCGPAAGPCMPPENCAGAYYAELYSGHCNGRFYDEGGCDTCTGGAVLGEPNVVDPSQQFSLNLAGAGWERFQVDHFQAKKQMWSMGLCEMGWAQDGSCVSDRENYVAGIHGSMFSARQGSGGNYVSTKEKLLQCRARCDIYLNRESDYWQACEARKGA